MNTISEVIRKGLEGEKPSTAELRPISSLVSNKILPETIEKGKEVLDRTIPGQGIKSPTSKHFYTRKNQKIIRDLLSNIFKTSGTL